MNNLHDVLIDTLKDIYHAEKQLTKALPKMAKAATSKQLRTLFESHLDETEGHLERLEQVFQELGEPVKAKVCHGMMGLVEEGKEVIEEQSGSHPASIDAALVSAAQKCEHYEIAAYGCARAFAEALGLTAVAQLLQETLDEEGAANDKLTSLAENDLNKAAAQAMSDSFDDHSNQEGKTHRQATKTASKRRTPRAKLVRAR